MKTKPSFLAIGIILAALGTSWGQPVITNQPTPQAAAPGTGVTFQVGATGTAPLAYQWQKNPGAGFTDLADRTNAALVLAGVQPWDASDYRVLVANSTGARTSAVARLYVMRPGVVTTNVVIDNFDDNRVTGWTANGHKGQATLTESNQQFHVHGYWPGVHTVDLGDTAALGIFSRNWSVANGQTVELRVDLVGMNEHATAGGMDLWNGSSSAGYALFKGRDFVHLCKPSLSVPGIHGQFFHERVLIKNTDVVLALAVTRVNPNVILTARVLDKENNNAVLYERSVVDTPGVDRTLTQAEMEAASGMHMDAGTDVGPPITSGSEVFLDLFQYTDGTRPAAEVTFDNLERWTSVWRPEIAIQLLSTITPKVNLTLSAAAPNSSWAIERAPQLTGPWTNLSALLIGANGSAQFQDTNSPNPAGFYRARQQ
jgi:immunoglobulin I-set domain protein